MRAKEIQELVKIVESSNIDEIEITRWWGQKVRIRKGVAEMQPRTVPGYLVHSTLPMQSMPTSPVQNNQKPENTIVSPESSLNQPVEVTNYIEIKAPMVGTFYRAPAPDAEPYVKEEDRITKGQVLCIIEAMKLMNEIESESSGRIVKILVDNAQPIEYNQPLFLIDPS